MRLRKEMPLLQALDEGRALSSVPVLLHLTSPSTLEVSASTQPCKGIVHETEVPAWSPRHHPDLVPEGPPRTLAANRPLITLFPISSNSLPENPTGITVYLQLLLVAWGWSNKLPHSSWLITAQCLILPFGPGEKPNIGVSLAKIKMSAGLHSFWRLEGRIHPRPFLVSRRACIGLRPLPPSFYLFIYF